MPPFQHYQPGERLGPYQIISLLGIGGTGAIYEVAQVEDGVPVENWQVFATFSQVWHLVRPSLAAAALILLGFSLGLGTFIYGSGLMSREANESNSPSGPLPGQMLPPCPQSYIEEDGGCWSDTLPITPQGKPQRCPTNPYVREVIGADGRLHCRIAVMAPSRYTKTPGGR